MLLVLVRLLRFASLTTCAIVVLAFVVFAANETKTASDTQREQIAAVDPSTASGASPQGAANGGSHESTIHKALDEASNDLTSPFASVASDSSSEWVTRGARTLLALLVYGFGLGFVGRSLRIHL